ncbi:MAG: S8 family serine peptidase, partial [Oscillospiraceae bacterium]|nr:S8 family serine peptidase [Oscillospiraceae bacterium]
MTHTKAFRTIAAIILTLALFVSLADPLSLNISAEAAAADSRRAAWEEIQKTLNSGTQADTAVPELPFSDVAAGDWYYEAVLYANVFELMNGDSGDTFSPQKSLTRAMFVTILGRLDGVDTAKYGSSSFSDVLVGQWYSPYVAWAADNGIVDGYGDGIFGTNDPITREQMAAVIARYLGNKKITLPAAANAVSGFVDIAAVSVYALDGLELMRVTGIIRGDDNGRFNPKKTATRAEAATIFMRLNEGVYAVTGGFSAPDDLTAPVTPETPTYSKVNGNNNIQLGGAVFAGEGVQRLRPNSVGVQENTRAAQEIIVKYANKASAETLKFDSDETALAKANELYDNPNVEYVQLNYPLTTMSDDAPEWQWGVYNYGQDVQGNTGLAGIDANLLPVWSDGTVLGEVIVAVIDTGIDLTHPALDGKLLGGYDFVDNDSDPSAGNGEEHATHLAGIIAGSGKILGAAQNVKILPIRFATNNGGYTSDAIRAIEYAEAQGAAIVVCAWGSYAYNPALYEAMRNSNMLFVSAAGNNGTTNVAYPAAFDLPNIISVASHNNIGGLARSSAYGVENVDFAAPGVGIFSSLPNGNYGYKSGTSQAAAITAGAAALVLGTDTTLNAEQLAFALTYTARPLYRLTGTTLTGGILDAGAAYTLVTSGEPIVAQNIVPVVENPYTEEILALLEAHTYFSELTVTEQTLLCESLGLPIYAMRECEIAGYTIAESTLIAQSIGATGFTVAEIQTIYARFDDEISAAIEMNAFSSFLRTEALGGEEADTVRALILAGYSVQNTVFAFPVAAALGIDIADVIVADDADIAAIRGAYPSLSQDTRDTLLEQAQMLHVRAEALFAYAAAHGKSGVEVAQIIALYIYERQSSAENQLFSDDGSETPQYPNAPFAYNVDDSESIQLNTGALTYRLPGVSLPGKNGFDLNIGLTYNGANANLVDTRVTYMPNAFVTIPIGTTSEPVAHALSNQLGAGWSFNFPYIEDVLGTKVLHLEDGSAYEIDSSFIASNSNTNYVSKSNLRDHATLDLQILKDNGSFTNSQVNSAYVLKYKDGKKTYFAADGRLLGMADRYGNTITFKHTSINGKHLITEITDTAGRVITFTYTTTTVGKTVTVSLPNNQSIQYFLEPISGQTDSYALTKAVDQDRRETLFTYSTQNGSDNYLARQVTPYPGAGNAATKPYALLTTVTYPTGATSNYTYESVTGNLGTMGIQTYYRLSSVYNVANGEEFGSKTITYQGNYTGTIPTTTGTAASLPLTYTYGSTVTDSFGTKTIYTFNNKHLLVATNVKSSTNATLTSQSITYNADKLPTNVSNKAYNGTAYIERVEKYTYNNYGDMLTHVIPLPSVSLEDHKAIFAQIVDQLQISNTQPQIATHVSQTISQATASLNNGTFTTAAQALQYCHDQIIAGAQSSYGAAFGATNLSDPVLAAAAAAYTAYLLQNIVPIWNGFIQYFGEQAERLDGTTTYTYDPTYHFVATKTHRTDASTTIKEEYTPTTDGKSVRYAKIYANNVLKAQTEYVYDASGNVTETRAYNDGFSTYISTFYEYANINTALPSSYNGVYLTRSYVTGVRDSDGALIDGGALPDGYVEQKFMYDAFGNVIAQTDANGNVTQYAYDALGRVTLQTNPDGTAKTWVYDSVANTIIATDERGNSIKYLYDPLGNIESVLDIESNTVVTSSVYDSKLRPAQVTSLDAVTTFTYDALNRVLTETVEDTDGNTLSSVTYAYNDAALVNGVYYAKTTKTIVGDASAPSVVTTEYTDNTGSVVMKGFVLNGTEYRDAYTYDYVGNALTALSAQDAAANRTFTVKYTYDYAGRALTETNALNQTTSRTYNALGRNVSATDYSGNTATSTYDNLGRLLTQTAPFETVGNTTSNAETRYDYDANGNVTRERVRNNAAGAATSFGETRYTYNARGFLTQSDSYDDGNVALHTAYTYDAAGNILTQTVGTSTTAYTYDRFGDVLTLTDALGQTEYYTYDLAGNVLTKTDRNGVTTTNTYDALGRILISTAGGDVTAYTYALNGSVIAQSNETATLNYTYDALGRVASVLESGDVEKYYTYDLMGNRTSLIAAENGELVANTMYSYDALNRLVTVSDGGTVAATYTYDTNGNRASLVYANGTSEIYAYNRANLVTNVANKRGATVLSSYAYTYRLDGNQISKTDHNG